MSIFHSYGISSLNEAFLNFALCYTSTAGMAMMDMPCLRARKRTDVQMTSPGPQISVSIWRKEAKVTARGSPEKARLFQAQVRRRNVWMVLSCSVAWTEDCISGGCTACKVLSWDLDMLKDSLKWEKSNKTCLWPLSRTHPGLPSTVVTKELANLWHIMPKQERHVYW